MIKFQKMLFQGITQVKPIRHTLQISTISGICLAGAALIAWLIAFRGYRAAYALSPRKKNIFRVERAALALLA